MKIILLGAPGSGKGTQADIIAKRVGIPHISSGSLLRGNKKLPANIKKKMDAGLMLKDEDVLGLVKDRLSLDDAQKGWILDGFPRTQSQAELLDDMYPDNRIRVLHLVISNDVILDRLTNRRTCSGCSRIYNLVNNKPEVEGKCDSCGNDLIQRDDDKEEVITKRLQVYDKMTAPLVKHYKDLGQLYPIDCLKGRSPEAIDRMIQEVLLD